jgi:hypothetical protein
VHEEPHRAQDQQAAALVVYDPLSTETDYKYDRYVFYKKY